MIEVIETVLASGIIIDTTRVELEHHRRGINGDRDGGEVGHRVLEIGFRANSHVLVAGEVSDDLVGGILTAVTRRTPVGIFRLTLHTILDGIRESIGHPSTNRAGVGTSVHTVDELLLRKVDQGSSGKGVSTLHGTASRERPARSALALVLHFRHNSLLAPVDRLGERGVGVYMHRGRDLAGEGAVCTKNGTLVLGVGQISELGEAEMESGFTAVVLLIVSLNHFEVVTEDVESKIDLINTVLLSVEGLELLKKELVLGEGARHGRSHDGEESDKKKLVHRVIVVEKKD